MKERMRALLVMAAAALAAAGGLQMAPLASAASLVQITNFGNNPGGLQMYVYVPDSVKASAPILVAMHQ